MSPSIATAGNNLDHVLARREQYLAALDRHYGCEAHHYGIRSSFEPLAQIAQSGFGGSPDPERNVTDRMFAWGEHGTAITVSRRINQALLHLSDDADKQALYSNAMFLAHGNPSWRRDVAASCAVGEVCRCDDDPKAARGSQCQRCRRADKEASMVLKRLGDVTPVARLTAEVAAGLAAEPEYRTEGAWIVALCQLPGEPAKQRAERVRVEAVAILESAEAAYLVACGLQAPINGWRVEPAVTRAKVKAHPAPAVKPKRRNFDPFARTFEIEAAQ